MMFRYIVLFLLPIAIRCENASNSSNTSELHILVISPFQHVLSLFKSDIVDKLMNANHSSSDLPDELHCTIQEIQSSLQQTTLANQRLFNQAALHVSDALESISRMENETTETEILLNELNTTVETAKEDVRLAEIAAKKAVELFSYAIDTYRAIMYRNRYRENDYGGDYQFGRYNGQHHFGGYSGGNRFPFHTGLHSRGTNCHFDVRHDSLYKANAKAMHEADDKLKKQQVQLKNELVKYRSMESQLRNISEQVMELNTTLQEQQTIKIMTEALNEDFQMVANRLKPFSSSSKRLLDVLMYILDYQSIVELFNSAYNKLLTASTIESTDLELSREMMNKTKQKLIYLSAKLPRMRYRRKQFHRLCAHQ
ncbi:unnamed protein product [Adineta ricciae]|uniref:Uncharacterized protein n=1 Tax=Adineta ricciae TaxID=249248 RepID=A0A814RVQ0_ADIRI|nr:unnamed protein product [Adineta ricciae]